MPEDNRNSSRVTSETVTVASGSGTPQTIIDLAPEQTLAIGYLKLEYASAGTVESELVLYDEPDGTASADLDDDIEGFFLSGSDREIVDDPYLSEIEDDLVVEPDGNSDADIKITVGGALITG